MDHEGITRKREKGYNSGYILKAKTIGYVKGTDVECKKNRGVKNNSKNFGLRNWEI